MKFLNSLILVPLLFLSLAINGQDEGFQRYEDAIKSRSSADFRIGFYNVENLFDLEDDSLTRDEAFTPEGENRYTFSRYKKKMVGLSRTLLAMGAWEPPEVIGLAEIESRWVLEGFTKFSPLKNAGYEIIHEDSPDRRGIDVACLYRPEKFNLILYKYYHVNFPFDPDRKTRDMLYVKGILPNSDTLHVFINHWPSRYGGQFVSEPGRAFLASMVREKVDSLNARYNNPLIVITGDFNDEPDDISVKDVLKAHLNPAEATGNDLVNLSAPIKYKFGTHSFAGEWGVLDHIIVSNSLLTGESTYTRINALGIFDAPWLLTKNAAGNDVPLRTFQGPAYKGGYSDHLPVFLDLFFNKETGSESMSQ